MKLVVTHRDYHPWGWVKKKMTRNPAVKSWHHENRTSVTQTQQRLTTTVRFSCFSTQHDNQITQKVFFSFSARMKIGTHRVIWKEYLGGVKLTLKYADI